MARNYFGTDGIRGKVGQFPITPEFMLKLGWAAGRVLSADRHAGAAVLGRDTRISGEMFSSALAAGLAAAGLDSHLVGVIPTPAVACLTRTMQATVGIVITASHNSYEDNGIKFFSADGSKLPDEIELAIEAALDEPLTLVASAKLGKMQQVVDASRRYIESCKQTFPEGLSLNGLKIVVDCAHGATWSVAPQVLHELGAEAVSIGDQPNGLNINLACGSTQPAELQSTVLAQHADLGIAFDGDGDRVIMVDQQGELLDGDELLFIIAMARHRQAGVAGVVGTLMSNLGMEHALRQAGIGFVRAKVGDRYVIEQMNALGWPLGGESSGHIICRDHVTTGDGIVAALQVLAAMVQSGQNLRALKGGMRKYPQQMINVSLPSGFDVMTSASIQAAVCVAETALGQRGRVLLRPSGTEPVVRVMVEGEDLAQVETIVAELAESVRQAIGKK
ncbi:MAG: phosphoglucosamine mutase [Thiohalomonadaceae bacterium]